MKVAAPHRGTIHLEDAEVVSVETFADEQYVIRLNAQKCAALATPGSFVHLSCDAEIPMRRPLSIMRADELAGTIDVLFKIVGSGLRALSARVPGEVLSVLGPIGQPFKPHPERPITLLVGGGVGIPPMIFLAERLSQDGNVPWQPLVLMGSEIPFPFEVQSSAMNVDGIEDTTHSTMPLLESLGVPARLSSLSGFPGCFNGYVTELAALWLEAQSAAALGKTEIFACGPTPMLEAIATVARQFSVPCQVSLEEFMACAVGGCAGCTVLVKDDSGEHMKRVCVDGPVFDANAVFPAQT